MKNFKLIGNSLSHSISPEIHNYTYDLLDLDAKYELFECDKKNMKNFLCSEIFTKNHCSGINVTIPYKEDVIEYLDSVDENAKIIGAINTIKVDNNRLLGYNTDYYGIEQTIDKNTVSNNTHLILGTGGACKPIVQYLLNNDAKCIYLASRTPENVRLNLDSKYENKVRVIRYDEIENLNGTYIINSTPVGTYPNIYESPVEESIFKNFTHAFDLTYNPSETLFLKYAKKNGLFIFNGLKMLVYQALKAIEIWNDIEISDTNKNEIFNHFNDINLTKSTNIYLVGITGVGKTTIGKILAKKINYKFLDLDEEIERISGKSISDIFSEGKDVFRNIESKVLFSTSNLNNTIISTGGGVISLAKNRDFLRFYNVFFLNRNLKSIVESISTEERPLLKDNIDRIYTLFDERKKYYEEVSSYEIDNSNIDSSIDEIIKIMEKNTLII